MRQLPHINEVQKKYKKRGFVVLAVAVQDKKEHVERLAKDKKWAIQFALDPELKAARAYRLISIPRGFLIDTKGVLRAIYTGRTKETELVRKLQQEIEALLPKKKE